MMRAVSSENRWHSRYQTRLLAAFGLAATNLLAGLWVATGAGGDSGPTFVAAAIVVSGIIALRVLTRSRVVRDVFWLAALVGAIWSFIVIAFMLAEGLRHFIWWNVPASFFVGALAGAMIATLVVILGKAFDWVISKTPRK